MSILCFALRISLRISISSGALDGIMQVQSSYLSKIVIFPLSLIPLTASRGLRIFACCIVRLKDNDLELTVFLFQLNSLLTLVLYHLVPWPHEVSSCFLPR